MLSVIFSSCLVKSTFRTASWTFPHFRSFTSTAGTSEYVPIDDVEKLERYCPGGYHPITIGALLNDRYRIVHKLGLSTYSTVWLARDQETEKYVAIKITVAAGDPADSQESNILRQLGVAGLKAESHAGAAYIPRILDEFSVSGPNGIHRCFVTAPGMMSLAEAKDASSVRLFQPPVARAIAAQLVQAVAFLHSQGIVHGVSSPCFSISPSC
jgi:serine/threonine protein kinase